MDTTTADKQQVIDMLNAEFNRWQTIIASMSEADITTPLKTSHWTTKDVVAHLWAWQQRTAARLDAGLRNHKPIFPDWPEQFDPEIEAEPDDLNAWIYETNRDRSWSSVYTDWQTQFMHIIELTEAISEKNLLDPQRFAWMDGQPLSLIPIGTCEHHAEHRGWLQI